MTFDEALEVLGIGDGDGAKEIRRAYLRAVKRHKPDRDPDGFRRVRDAYELIEVVLANPWLLKPPEGDASSGDRPDAAEAETPRDGAPAEIADPVDPSGEPDPSAHFLDALIASSRDATPDEAVVHWRRALDDHPDSEPVRWRLLEAAWAAEHHDEASSLALRWAEEGQLQYAVRLALIGPPRVPKDLLGVIAKTDDPDYRVQLVAAYRVFRQPRRAASLASKILRAARDDVRVGVPVPAEMVDLVLQLERRGHGDHAERLALAFEEWMRSTDREAAVLRGIEHQWLFVSQLRALRGVLPDTLQRGLATSVAKDSARYARDAAYDLTRREAHEARSVLRERGPAFYALVGSVLESVSAPQPAPRRAPAEPDQPAPPSRRASRSPLWVGLVAAVALLNVLRTCDDGKPRARTEADPIAAMVQERSDNERRVHERLEQLRLDLRNALGDEWANRAFAIVDALEQRKCSDAQRAVVTFSSEVPEAVLRDAEKALKTLADQFDARCKRRPYFIEATADGGLTGRGL